MNISIFNRTGLALIAGLATSLLQAATVADQGVAPRPDASGQQTPEARVGAQYAALPLRFEPNMGQTDPSVRFLARVNGYTLFLTSSESVMVFAKPSGAVAPTASSVSDDAARLASTPSDSSTAVVRMRYVGANTQAQVQGLDPLPGTSNYLIGNDRAGWQTDIQSFAKVQYSDIYPGIDLVYYGRGRSIEYDFVLRPGADPAAIRLKFKGPEQLTVNAAGELLLKIPSGELRQPAAVMYQEGPNGPVLVAGNYVVHGDEVGFAVADYDRSRPLIIDPVIVYSTYLGGSGFDQANAIHVGATGDAYVTGVTASTNFPIEGVPGSAFGGGQDVFVTKFSLAGSTLTYSTYIGGIGNDIGNDIVVSGAGTAYVTGSTTSINYPVVTPTIAAQVGDTDAFLTKLTSAGNDIVYSTFWGSTGFEEGTAVAVDPADNAYISGNTSAPDFPTQTPFQAALAGGMDAFMTKFSVAGNSIVYSTYLGGAGDDRATGMAVADDAAVFVIGSTTSATFPTTSTSFQPALAGNRDAFLTHFSLAGNALLYSTFLGGTGDDEAFGIAIDAPMNAYLTGRTNSADFPTLGPAQALFGGGAYDAFVTRISPSGNSVVYSTYLGGAGDDQGRGIAINGALNAFVTGGTTSANFPTRSAFQANLSGPSDAFVTKLFPTGASIEYSTYLGGSGTDEGRGIGIDLVGSAYVSGFTESNNFPTMDPFQAAFGAVRDAFVTKLVEAGTPDFIFADGFESSVTRRTDR